MREASLSHVPSFLYARDVELDLPEVGSISVDVSFGGNFLAVVRAKDLGVPVQVDQVSNPTAAAPGRRDRIPSYSY